MIPKSILGYLQRHGVEFERLQHPEAVTGAELAASLHVSGRQVAKTVLVESAGSTWMAVLPACEQVDPVRLGEALHHGPVRLLGEEEVAGLFPDCQLGAEPPFGQKYGVPVIVDSALASARYIVVRAGSHREALALPYPEYVRLEHPKVASFAVFPQEARVTTAAIRP